MQLPEATTRDRLIDAAGDAFARAGFREARIRDICARAGANLAAVNYHFGGKEGLYRAVLEQAESHARSGQVQAAIAGLGPEEQLRVFVRQFMERMFDEGKPAWQSRLMVRELAEPTDALDLVVERTIRPQWELLLGIVARLVGPGADCETLELSAASIIGQCVLYRNSAAIIDRLLPQRGNGGAGAGEAGDAVERTARHIAEFSLAALAARRNGRAGRSEA